jgi:Asp-tRNA(Asn)/Glu-tRNA(Gln) amidotransferase A subunit family amidase
MPIGLQLLAPPLQEGKMLNVAYNLEHVVNFNKNIPTIPKVRKK